MGKAGVAQEISDDSIEMTAGRAMGMLSLARGSLARARAFRRRVNFLFGRASHCHHLLDSHPHIQLCNDSPVHLQTSPTSNLSINQ